MATTDERQAARNDRIDRLQTAVDDYVQQEQARIDTEVAAVKGILSGRRGGQGAAGDAAQAASEFAATDLAWFLGGQ